MVVMSFPGLSSDESSLPMASIAVSPSDLSELNPGIEPPLMRDNQSKQPPPSVTPGPFAIAGRHAVVPGPRSPAAVQLRHPRGPLECRLHFRRNVP